MIASTETAPAPHNVDGLLTRHFLLDYPLDAARSIEESPPAIMADILQIQPSYVLLPVFDFLNPDLAADVIAAMDDTPRTTLLAELPPHYAVKVLCQWPDEQRDAQLAQLPDGVRTELQSLMNYPPDTAGRLMDTRIPHFRPGMTVANTLDILRQGKLKTASALFLVDDAGRLSAKVDIQQLATATPDTHLSELALTVQATVQCLANNDEISELFERHQLLDLPVIDLDQRLMGIIYHSRLVRLSQEELVTDVVTMVGASREERALSNALFAVRKRMPWLQINLLTAFMAAAVVGLFESTIAQFTALAVLLPVVAGQSGNAGAQALAVTMRGLALREITTRHWLRVMLKEVRTGLMNGLCIAVTCGLGVFIWSQSVGLVMVICSSMVLAMVAAGFAGALVPIVLVRLGQDPAQASSIILTTVTDITGFFAFLGIANLLAGLL